MDPGDSGIRLQLPGVGHSVLRLLCVWKGGADAAAGGVACGLRDMDVTWTWPMEVRGGCKFVINVVSTRRIGMNRVGTYV